MTRPDDAITVTFTRGDHQLLAEHTAADPELLDRFPDMTSRQSTVVALSLEEIERLLESLIEASRDNDDGEVQDRLDRLCRRLNRIVDEQDEEGDSDPGERPPRSFRRADREV
ncbi:MAG: hypothetical protein PVF43_08975 [Candidatus Eiseniibacteriota bacterium]|jgi:hypothetical protein